MCSASEPCCMTIVTIPIEYGQATQLIVSFCITYPAHL